jgi:flagellar brake protein
MENENDYLVRNQKVIAEHLTDIYKSKCILSAYFGENNTSFLTAILELDLKNNILKIDSAPSDLLNRLLLNSPKVLFRTQIDGIKVSFSGKNIKKSKHGDHPVFEMPIPSAIFWMQRRQFYRVKVPLAHSGTLCEVTFTDDEDTDTPIITKCKFRLADISIKGMALLNPNPELNDRFEFDKTFTNCKLFLHEGVFNEVGFVIKYISESKVTAHSNQQRIGCRFTEISNSFETYIQRYMQDIEIQLKNIG